MELWSKLDGFWEWLIVGSGITALGYWFVKSIPKIAGLFVETRFYDIYLARHKAKIARLIVGPRIQMLAHGPIVSGPPQRRYALAQVLLINKSQRFPALLPTKALSNARVYVQFFNKDRHPILHEMLMLSNVALQRYAQAPVNIAGSMNDGTFFIFGLGLFLDGDHRRVMIPNHEGIANAYPLSFSPACLCYGLHLVRIRVSTDNSDIVKWFRVYRDADPITFSITHYKWG